MADNSTLSPQRFSYFPVQSASSLSREEYWDHHESPAFGQHSSKAKSSSKMEKEGLVQKLFFRFVSGFIAIPLMAFITIAFGFIYAGYEEYFLLSRPLYNASYVLLFIGTLGLLLSTQPSPVSSVYRVARYGRQTRLLALLLLILASFPQLAPSQRKSSIPLVRLQVINNSNVPIPLGKSAHFAAVNPQLPSGENMLAEGQCKVYRRNWMGVALPLVVAPNAVTQLDLKLPESKDCVEAFKSGNAMLALSIHQPNGDSLTESEFQFSKQELESGGPMVTIR